MQADDGSTSSSLNRFLKDSHKARRVHTFNYVDGPHIGKKTSEVSRTSNPNAPERTELPSATDEKKGAKICASCAEIKESMQRCTRCKAAYYCNATCQLAHWQVHKQPCLAAAQLSGAGAGAGAGTGTDIGAGAGAGAGAVAGAGALKKSEFAARALTDEECSICLELVDESLDVQLPW